MKQEFRAGALWVGGCDNYVIEILGNGHKPGLKKVRIYDPNGSVSEAEFVGNRIAQRHDFVSDAELTALVKNWSLENSAHQQQVLKRLRN
jgi:hypothetical protein